MPIQSAPQTATITNLPGRSYGPTFSHNQAMPARLAPDKLQRNKPPWSDSSGVGIGAGGAGCAAGADNDDGGAGGAVGEKVKASKSS
jgi:hypothetical protein